jgi:hypothetical protein
MKVISVEPPAEPSDMLTDPRDLLVGYLDFYRDAVLRKLDGMSEHQLRTSALPSGWTPLELLKHLAYVERRWLRWGFAAEPVDEPWGDEGPDGRWYVAEGETADDIQALFLDQCARSREIVAAAQLTDRARTGGRFTPAEPESPEQDAAQPDPTASSRHEPDEHEPDAREPDAREPESAEADPTLIWILFHLLQEYARHVGQLDVVRELTDGVVGE